MSESQKDLVIGFDLGTSSLKLVVLDFKNNQSILELNQPTHRSKINHENKLFNEQDVDVLVELIEGVLKKIPDDLLNRTRGIQICGQMHGVVLWNSKNKKHSNLVTWQDGRCSDEFLKNLPVKSQCDLNIGFGGGTLFWYNFNQKSYLDEFDYAGTIDDYLTYLLCGVEKMSTQNAVGWGFIDLNKMNWQPDLLNCNDFPTRLLPEVVPPGYQLASSINLFGRTLNIPIYAPLGDLASSVYSCLEKETDCVINISTSSQVCVSIQKDKYDGIKDSLPKSVAFFPYFNDYVMLVSASLNGGNVLEKFVDTIIEWNTKLGLMTPDETTKNKVWAKLIELGEESFSSATDSELECKPLLFGERHDQTVFASIGNIRPSNLSIGKIFNSMCKGIVKNLKDMITMELLEKQIKCNRILATGGSLLRNPILKRYLETELNGIPIEYKSSSDSAMGAAYFLRDKYTKEMK